MLFKMFIIAVFFQNAEMMRQHRLQQLANCEVVLVTWGILRINSDLEASFSTKILCELLLNPKVGLTYILFLGQIKKFPPK